MSALIGFDSAAEVVTLPVWLSGAFAALFIVVLLVAVSRSGGWRIIAVLVPFAVVAGGAAMTQGVLVRMDDRARAAAQREAATERRAIDARAAELAARAIAPGSALSCLDALAADAIESACEKAVFASPASAAQALSYAGARLTLLADALSVARRSDPADEARLAGLRRAVEHDAFGAFAYVLAKRDGCTAERCAAFALLHDASALEAHLKQRLYESLLAQYSGAWTAPLTPPSDAMAEAPVPSAAAAPASPKPPIASVLPNIDFPSAASIPPVSIMNAEPPLPKTQPEAAVAPSPTPAARQSPAPAKR